jgi:hypothetical protein
VATFVDSVEDFLAGLGAARRSPHTLAGYRNDLFGVGGRIAAQRHAGGASAERLDVAELDQRVMRRAFAAWASDHSEGSLLRAWACGTAFSRSSSTIRCCCETR